MLVLLAAPVRASASVSPPLPGPPPTAGLDFPAAPAPGTVPAPGPLGPAASLPTKIGGAGLRSGFVLVHGRQLTLAIACRTGGRVSLSASALGSGVLARGSYSCSDRQGSTQISLAPAAARRLAALKSTIGRVALGFGNGEQFSVTLETRPTAPIDWSSGGMECSLLAPYDAYLVAPNFTVTPPAIIDVRPWVAWYTSANGWRWLGTIGVNRSSWYRWYATPGSGYVGDADRRPQPMDLGPCRLPCWSADPRDRGIRIDLLVRASPVHLGLHPVAADRIGAYQHVLPVPVGLHQTGRVCPVLTRD